MIADSGVVETYLLTKAEMQYLPDSELKIIFQYFVSQREPDRPNKKEAIDAQFKDMVSKEEQKLQKMQSVIDQLQAEKATRLK